MPPALPAFAQQVTDEILRRNLPHSLGWIDTQKAPDKWRYRILLNNGTFEMEVKGSPDTCYRKAAQMMGLAVPDRVPDSLFDP